MNPQGTPSRKRAAPGASPAVHQPLNNLPAYPNAGAQLSNDQFLQWGQDPTATSTVSASGFPVDVGSYNAMPYPTAQELPLAGGNVSNQLTRRPLNQLVSRNHAFDSGSQPLVEQPNEGDGWGESLAELEQRALIAKREAQAKRKQIPPFVQKLSSFLEDPKNINWIRWSEDGNSFIVLDEDEFARKLIPELFKHNNYASFVRQLNMYGFHKKVGLSDNSMRASERKNKSPSEYANPYFKRGHPDLLWLIQKPKNISGQGSKGAGKGTKTKTEDGEDNEDEFGDDMTTQRDERSRNRGQLTLAGMSNEMLPKEQLAGVYRELQTIRQQQQVISSTILKLRREHEQLYAQAANFQEQHTRHENSINAILTFLATVYNRSLQGHDGQQNLTNAFSGIIPQDHGSVVDYDDYALGNIGAELSPGNQRGFKKQPLLLKAPPKQTDSHSRANTLSPSASSNYDRAPQSRKQSSQIRPHTGAVEEVHDSGSPPQTTSQQSQSQQLPQRDIMSVIQNSIARNGMQTTSLDFPNVLSSLENSGGHSALTPDQRADMLRLITHDTNATDPNATASPNNALITPTPPPMPHNYSARLANTRHEIDNLVKMQAEQDRSVQNLTNLLQPLSPTGSIPGIGDANVPPPAFDLDQIFNSHDYFTDIPDGFDFGDGTTTCDQNDSLHATADEGINNGNFNLDDLGAGPSEDDPLFEDPTSNPQQPGGTGYHGSSEGYHDVFAAGSSNNNTRPRGGTGSTPTIKQESGRVVESFTDSESTSPANTVVDDALINNNDDSTYISPKRRRRA